MAQEVTLGGDRLGSGNKQKVELHNYGMNSFNLEQDWKSSMAPGVLYPFLKLVGTNHDTFDIDLDSFVRTLPTQGPLFGSFKLQADIFSVPIRLYQGILHNNPIDIGLKMNQVYLPKLMVTHNGAEYTNQAKVENTSFYTSQIATNSLLKYLGVSGLGTPRTQHQSIIQRPINAIPILAYYDIFKCYYSNKQEENAYVITPGNLNENASEIEKMSYVIMGFNGASEGEGQLDNGILDYQISGLEIKQADTVIITMNGINLRTSNVRFCIYKSEGGVDTLIDNRTLEEWYQMGHITKIDQREDEKKYAFTLTYKGRMLFNNNTTYKIGAQPTEEPTITSKIKLTPFALKNIDDMRNELLKSNELGEQFIIGGDWNAESGSDETGLPYSTLFAQTTRGINYNAFDMNGLVVKTYQSDLFNNWLDTEYIDGENGIAAISAVDTSSGVFTMDTLNLAEKIYELLNRIVVSGGTYQDWQEAVYGEGTVRMCETPMYMGGMAAEVMFEEVISSAETNVNDDRAALGSLGGKGTQVGKKGGNNIHVKCDEPSYIIGIVSLTPRICYSQGNDWDMMDLDTLNDLHVPGLDGIGFQNLMIEQFAWWDTKLQAKTGGLPYLCERNAVGKQTAWINYQTAVDKCYGDFAKQDGYSFMVLNRNYEAYLDDDSKPQVKDLTTYIDPEKFNYAFAYNELAAQNFWVQIHSKVIARRKMGAQQIPNL